MAAKKTVKTPAPPADLAGKPSIEAPVNRLMVSPLNMRADEPADEAIRGLEADLLENGQILPMFVRAADLPGFDYEVLDGRRRLYAYNGLMAAAKLPPEQRARVVVCETPDEIAQAIVIANTDRIEPSHADYLLAVHKLLREFNSVDQIARILSQPPKKVRQAARLGALDQRFLRAYQREELDLADLRRLTRVKDPDAIADMAEAADRGELSYYDIDDDAGGGIELGSRFAFIADADAYLKAGGTIEQDIFEDIPDVLNDTTLARRLWMDAVRPLAETLNAMGPQVHFNPDHTPAPEGLCELPYDWPRSAEREHRDAIEAAGQRIRELTAALDACGRAEWPELARQWCLAQLDMHGLKAQPADTRGVSIWASETAATGLKLAFFIDENACRDIMAAARSEAGKPAPASTTAPIAAAAAVEADTGGYTHDSHKTTTTLCGDGLALSLAAQPAVAFDALLSALFSAMAIDFYRSLTALLPLRPHRAYQHGGNDLTLRGELVDNLYDWRAAWKESGKPVFEYVSGLDGEAKGILLATIVALQIDLTEDRTDNLRPAARAEAALIAKALGHDIRDHWAPDDAFWRLHTKKQLLGFAALIDGADVKALSKLKADALYPAFAEVAAAANFVPPALVLTHGAETGGEGDKTLAAQGDNPGAETEPSEAAE